MLLLPPPATTSRMEANCSAFVVFAYVAVCCTDASVFRCDRCCSVNFPAWLIVRLGCQLPTVIDSNGVSWWLDGVRGNGRDGSGDDGDRPGECGQAPRVSGDRYLDPSGSRRPAAAWPARH